VGVIEDAAIMLANPTIDVRLVSAATETGGQISRT